MSKNRILIVEDEALTVLALKRDLAEVGYEVAVFRFVLMEPNRGALVSAVQLEQLVNSPTYDARQQFTTADKPHRVRVDFLSSPKVAIIGSVLLIMLIGWIDYATDFNVTVFYFVPV